MCRPVTAFAMIMEAHMSPFVAQDHLSNACQHDLLCSNGYACRLLHSKPGLSKLLLKSRRSDAMSFINSFLKTSITGTSQQLDRFG